MDHTKKGPGRPAHNSHPQTCSGQPLTPAEMRQREIQRRERKILRQLEKQKEKLKVTYHELLEENISESSSDLYFQAKGIEVTIDSLREEYELKRESGGVSGEDDDDDDDGDDEDDDVAGDDTDEIIDVVGEEGVGFSSESWKHAVSDNKPNEAQERKNPSNPRASFSIDSILSTVVVTEESTTLES